MIKRTLGAIASMCGGALSDPIFADIGIVGVTKDSRDVRQGQLYIPLVGDNFDGHDFAVSALENGAAACLWQSDRPLPESLAAVPLVLVQDTLVALQRLASKYRDELDIRVIGITGSNGKTTTKDMVASVLGAVFRVHKTAGNLNNHIGLPLTVLQLDETIDIAVLEMGMSGFGEIELLASIGKPDIAIITNIGDAHMLQLGSRQGIAKAKLEIIAGLKRGGLLLMNGDEPLLTDNAELHNMLSAAGAKVQTFGLEAGNDWRAANMSITTTASEFDIVAGENMQDNTAASGLRAASIPLPGQHNVANALAAIAAAIRLGVDGESIRQGLQGIELTGMRIEPVRAYNGAMVLNDAYNANPTAVRAAIDLVAQLDGYRRKWLVLGDMLELGPDEAEMHREIGMYITPDKADAVLTFGELSKQTARGSAEQFGIQAVSSDEAGERAVQSFDDKERLIERLHAQLQPEDLVLVKGSRGMRMEQIVHALQRD
ncbi:UDP-N-acetylmuramoyl-tripeptide--D-alanyl-D-alanine ligase [Paenibacillus plantiphilus]|uniref:UDP-N-acetylmuramoyl-tripeptide--D-alanyl-D-alanine ligase n=1 Tax=Paenibacillus plantiphilus TaxID=2905650 RepID=A0ABM9CJ98_9BACL|nr:UDP-N-acetylmuramoyl-tripeptide--D-alanyl-D-alanine ligase [Paenibacillus plantiphilus]CAH1213819.1 UDP-N-acetylmuramoyl-tripeptide--D-alanyl-D-alanine ligase [Paenibacillus plantiphilus]